MWMTSCFMKIISTHLSFLVFCQCSHTNHNRCIAGFRLSSSLLLLIFFSFSLVFIFFLFLSSQQLGLMIPWGSYSRQRLLAAFSWTSCYSFPCTVLLKVNDHTGFLDLVWATGSSLESKYTEVVNRLL